MDSLIYEIEYNNIKIDEEYRQLLKSIKENEGLEKLYEMAQEIDPEAMKKISKNDYKRISRVLEIYHETGKTKTQQEAESRLKEIPYNYKVFAIEYERKKLYDRINKRVDIMIENGLIKEVQNLLNKYERFPTAMQGLGYKEVKQYLENQISKEEMIEKIKQESRRYAKRQMTWFKKNDNTIWINGLDSIPENIKIIMEESNIG